MNDPIHRVDGSCINSYFGRNQPFCLQSIWKKMHVFQVRDRASSEWSLNKIRCAYSIRRGHSKNHEYSSLSSALPPHPRPFIVSKPPFLRLETLISPHKILSLESQFCLRTDGTPRGLRKSLFEPSRLSTRLNKTTSILQLNSSNFEFNERSRWMSQKSVQNRDLFAQSFLSCRANARTYAEITSNWFTGFELEPWWWWSWPKPTTRVTRYFKINLTSAPLITFLGPANFISVSLPILFSPVLPSISPRVTKFPPLRPRTFRLHKLTRSAD